MDREPCRAAGNITCPCSVLAPSLAASVRSQDDYRMVMGKPEGLIHPVHSLPLLREIL